MAAFGSGADLNPYLGLLVLLLAGAFVGLVEPMIFDRAQAIMAQAAKRYSPETMLGHLERLHQEHGFLRKSLLRMSSDSASRSLL